MSKVKAYTFGFESDEKRRVVTIYSNHLQGAVRKLFQMYKVDNLLRISEA